MALPTAIQNAITATSISISFILLGNSITQSFMSVPALLVDFPPASPPSDALTTRARLLGAQWPVFWRVGNVFFRPISTLNVLLYGAAAYSSFTTPSSFPPHILSRSADGSGGGHVVPGKSAGDWRLLALAAACHAVVVVHSARNMQPLNARLEALGGIAGGKEGAKMAGEAEALAREWARRNYVRVVGPLVAGFAALWSSFVT